MYRRLFIVLCIPFLALLFTLHTPSVWGAYELTDDDQQLLERAETKIMALIEHDPDDHITRQRIVNEFTKISKNPSLSPRFKRLLEELTAIIYYKPFEAAIRSLSESEYEQPWSVYLYSWHTLVHDTGDELEKHRAMRTFLESLFPEKWTDHIHEVIFYDNAFSNTAAFVERRAEDSSQRRIAINEAGVNREDTQQAILENAELFIHEMMHIITLNETQMDYMLTAQLDAIAFEQEQDNCGNHLVVEGCLAVDSYLQRFVDTFRTDELFEKVAFEENIYAENPQAYVNRYAARNEGEDIAESFAYYILQKPPKRSRGQAEQKIAFFDQFPEFVTMQETVQNILFTDNQ